MKLTKKILSLVLAVALVLGSIAVAANAADYDGLTYEGSQLSYRMVADKTEAKPGETVTVSVYMTTNFYTGASGGEFFLWTAGVFEALGSNYTVNNFRNTFTSTYTNPANVNSYPSNYGTSDYVGFQASHALKANVTAPEILNDELVYEFTFTVAEGVEAGTTAKIFMPAEAVKSTSLPGKKGMTYQCIGTSATDPTSVGNWCESVDVSAASVTITVLSAIDYCNYDALQTTYNNCDTVSNNKDYYVAEDYEAWETALAEAKAILDDMNTNGKALYSDEEQAKIDDAASTLQAAYDKLEASYVDLTPIVEAIAACDTPEYGEELYDATAWAAWEDALENANDCLSAYANLPSNDTNAKLVQKAADQLTNAYAALVPITVDLTNLKAAIEECDEPEYEKAAYAEDLYTAWENALAAAEEAVETYEGAVNTQENQAAVLKAETDLEAAFEALVADLVDLSDLVKAVEESVPEYTADYYDADEYAEYTAAKTAAENGLVDYATAANTAENQAAVAKLASDLRAAYAELDARFVDDTPISNAITAYGTTEYAEEYYDADEYAAYTAALAAAQDADFTGMPDTQANRDAVAKIAEDLKAAHEALDARFVDYAKLEQAVADYGTTEHPEFYYTADSWANYQAALAAAVEANDNRPAPLPAASEENQAAVDAYADALEKAYNELTAGECHVISVTPLQENYVVNNWINFAVLVEGTPAKIQIVKASGVTSTYTPETSHVVSITDNGDGTQTWIINRRVFEEEYTEYAKAKMGRNWDTGVVPFDVKCTVEDADVRSVEVTLDGEVIDTALRTDIPTVTIVTGPATQRVRLVDPVTGGSLTYDTPAYVNVDGTKVWVIVKQYYQVKQYDLDIYFRASKGAYIDSGLDLEINIVEELESQLPSTNNAEDAIYSAEVAKTRLLKGATQTFTYTTDKDCKAVRILYADGTVFRTIKTSTSVEDGVATWVYECAYNSLGERSYIAEALYGETWIADDDSAVSFNIAY